MPLEAYAPFCCLSVAALTGALMYVIVVGAYRREHDREMEARGRRREQLRGEEQHTSRGNGPINPT